MKPYTCNIVKSRYGNATTDREYSKKYKKINTIAYHVGNKNSGAQFTKDLKMINL